MKLHEYQAKQLLRNYQLPIPAGIKIDSPNEVLGALEHLNVTRGVVKAQAYTGGRGKAGGIKLFSSLQEAQDFTRSILAMTLVTKQTGPLGVPVDSILIEEAHNITHEYYLAILVDRVDSAPVLIISPEGGMDIEEVAEKSPEKIMKIVLSYGKPISDGQKAQAAAFLSLEKQEKELGDILQGLYDVFCAYDAMLLEINPLISTVDKGLYILDCKFDIDDNAVYRQIKSGGDPFAEKNKAEIDAKKWGMSYIALEGEIGCMVNGAGLAMATMDSIKYFGKEPANFLDVGGSANEEAVAKAFEIISSDKAVKCIFINVFGGIMKCDTIALGIVAAVKKVGLNVPLVVRLEGTNVELGKKIIDESGLDIVSASDLADGAEKAVSLLQNK
jgi:succinyl-CoA synthetase beta subunit